MSGTALNDSKIFHSLISGFNFLILQAISEGFVTPGLYPRDSYVINVYTAIMNWIDQVDDFAKEENDTLELIKQELTYRLREGKYLNQGKEQFISCIHAFFTLKTNSQYKKVLLNIIETI